jgi:thiol-disulfide isomerase/thioredoxin
MSKRISVIMLAILVAGLVITSGVQAKKAQSSAGIVVKTIGVAEVEGLIKANKGKVLLLDIWATWCPPCREEIPGFVAIAKGYAKQGVVVIGLAADEGGPAAVQSFVDKNKINYPIYSVGEEVLTHFGIEAFPTTFIYNKEGKVSGKHIGYTSKEEFDQELKPLLKTK